MALCEKILIAGFSGAGKTSLLKEVKHSAPAGWELFDDLDDLVLKSVGKKYETLAEFITQEGWEKFRLKERQALESWLKEEGKGVLALGGGTLSPLIWELYGSQSKISFCHIAIPFEIAWKRLISSNEIRPLVQKGEQELRKIFEERQALFQQIDFSLEGTAPSSELAENFWNHFRS